MLIDRRLITNFDWKLVLSVILIPLLGLIVLYSAGYNPLETVTLIDGNLFNLEIKSIPAFKQFLYLIAGLLIMIFVSLIPTDFFKKYAYIFYFITIILLVSVMIYGSVSKGSRRWIDFGVLKLQPSEFAKLATMIAVARYLSSNTTKNLLDLKHLFIPLLIVFLPFLLIVIQPDLGTSLAVMFPSIAMILFIGIKFRILLTTFLVGCVSLIPFWNFLAPYQKRRVTALFNPDFDPLGAGYHIIQSKIAVGSGGLWGKGFLKGTQTQLLFLPEHTTDFIFSVLAEEWGFIGCLLLLFLYFILLYRLLSVAIKSNSLFTSLLCVGVTSYVFFHVLVNIGMVIGLLPVVGIPLVLFSYGGSSMLSTMVSLGIVLGISIRKSFFK